MSIFEKTAGPNSHDTGTVMDELPMVLSKQGVPPKQKIYTNGR
jgi:hypothetical protein